MQLLRWWRFGRPVLITLLLGMFLVAPALADSGSGAGVPCPAEPDPDTELASATLDALLRAAGQFF